MATATKNKSKIRLQPMGERIVIQRVESEETTAGGIVLPDSAREKPARGTVVAIGSGKLLDDGIACRQPTERGRSGPVQQLCRRERRDRRRRIPADA